MSSATDQQQLAGSVQRIKVLIERKRDGNSAVDVPAFTPCASLDRLVAAFHMSPFERDVLLWCAGVELDSALGDLTATLPGHDGRRYPSFSLALSVLPDAHWSALVPAAPMRYWRMIEPGSGGLTHADLRIDERILHELAGVPYLDARLTTMSRPGRAEQELTAAQQELANTICDTWTAQAVVRPIMQLVGKDRHAQFAITYTLAQRFGFVVHLLDAKQLPAQAAELDALVRLWQRECILGRNLLVIDRKEHGVKDDAVHQLVTFCDQLDMPLFLLGQERLRGLQRTILNFDVHPPDRREQAALWRDALGEHARTLNGTVDRLVDQFDLSWPEIRNAAGQATALDGKPDEQRLRNACRAQARPKLDDLAKRIDTRAGWDQLILADREKSTLRDVALHLAHRSTVHGTWGFGKSNKRGAGITALFSGPSGTGKTLAAEILAKELDLDLFKIDLSQVVSKYIGESEKNLSRIFDAAESGGAILLFDEADALFGKRSEVKDSHDRYANIEVSYLLQRMEEYRGLAILTTNMKQALDSAFMRRLTFVVNFRFPDMAQRAAIWSCMFPKECPQVGIDHQKLAQLNISGGNIRSISLTAAHYAAAENGPLGMSHLLRAARSEYDKLDKALTTTETRGWV